jgi:hypothetical protein
VISIGAVETQALKRTSWALIIRNVALFTKIPFILHRSHWFTLRYSPYPFFPKLVFSLATYSSVLKMQAADSSEILANITILRHILEDINHGSENLKSYCFMCTV